MIKLIISEPCLLLNAKLNEYTSKQIEYRDEFNYVTVDFEVTPLDEIIDCLQSPAFGSEKKVVIAKNPYFFKDEKLKLPFTNDFSLLEKYLYSENSDTCFIMVCPKKYFNMKNKLYTVISKMGSIDNLLFEDAEDLRTYGESLLKKANVKMTLKAKEIFFARCEDVCKLEREIAKLSIYGEEIDEALIDKMVSRPLEDDVFELSNALLSKNRKSIMKIYTDLKLLKMEPVTLIALLAAQFRLLLQVSILKRQKKSDNDIATFLKVHPYRIKKSSEYLKQYSLQSIKDVLIDLANLDEQIKTGQKDRFIDFEIFLATK